MPKEIGIEEFRTKIAKIIKDNYRAVGILSHSDEIGIHTKLRGELWITLSKEYILDIYSKYSEMVNSERTDADIVFSCHFIRHLDQLVLDEYHKQ